MRGFFCGPESNTGCYEICRRVPNLLSWTKRMPLEQSQRQLHACRSVFGPRHGRHPDWNVFLNEPPFSKLGADGTSVLIWLARLQLSNISFVLNLLRSTKGSFQLLWRASSRATSLLCISVGTHYGLMLTPAQKGDFQVNETGFLTRILAGVSRWNSTQVSSPRADLSSPHAEDSFPFRPSPLREQLSRRSLDDPPLQSSALPRPQDPPSYQDARFRPADVSARPSLGYADPGTGYADVSTRPPSGYADVSNGASPPSRRRSFSDLRRSGSFGAGEGGGAPDRTTPSHCRRGSGGGAEAAIRGVKAWTTAQEWLRHGKVEEAYLEVLSLGDELQVRGLGFRCCVILLQGLGFRGS
jgi:hypothetical protein